MAYVPEIRSASAILVSRFRAEAEMLALRLAELAVEISDPLELFDAWQTFGRQMRVLDAELRKTVDEIPGGEAE
ncbi:hypothetical protein [Nocardia acidivorans]|uniref:hypothetical protein n=1 Tax=Nocardia acidivorans TaxID=404580 RepID=UPI000AB51157|nr:hypothetical protein [Nocardia acidivorans]